jgi:polar amino acid transport system substrate-binding protein
MAARRPGKIPVGGPVATMPTPQRRIGRPACCYPLYGLDTLMTRLCRLRTRPALLSLLLVVLATTACIAPAVAPPSASPTPSAQTDLLQEVRRRGVLRVATDANYPPQSFRRVDGSWQGFDIEVGRALARRLGVQVEFLAVSFEQVTAGGWRGRWDVHIGSMTITPEREQALIFSAPYYFTPAAFAVHAKSPLRAIADLEGDVVGVAAMTTYQAYLSGTLLLADAEAPPPPAVRMQVYETEALAMEDLAASNARLDAVLMALPTIKDAMARGAPIRPLGRPVFYESLALAFDRASPQDAQPLADELSRLIVEMRAEGTLARISRQFYGVDLSRRAR